MNSQNQQNQKEAEKPTAQKLMVAGAKYNLSLPSVVLVAEISIWKGQDPNKTILVTDEFYRVRASFPAVIDATREFCSEKNVQVVFIPAKPPELFHRFGGAGIPAWPVEIALESDVVAIANLEPLLGLRTPDGELPALAIKADMKQNTGCIHTAREFSLYRTKPRETSRVTPDRPLQTDNFCMTVLNMIALGILAIPEPRIDFA